MIYITIPDIMVKECSDILIVLPVRKIDTGQKNYHYKSSIRRYYNIPKNTDTNIPRAVFGDPNQNSRKSDRFVEDGKYLRLKSLVLSYSLPTNLIKRLNIEK